RKQRDGRRPKRTADQRVRGEACAKQGVARSGGIDVGSTDAPKPNTAARVGPTHEWHLLPGKGFRHSAFHLGPGLGQPAVVVPPPLLQPRLVPVRAAPNPVGSDRVEQVAPLTPNVRRPETTTMPLAVLYARFAPRPNPDECDSVEKQLERCRAYSEGHDYTVIAEYEDKDLSGERADNRPGLQKAITAAWDRKAVSCV